MSLQGATEVVVRRDRAHVGGIGRDLHLAVGVDRQQSEVDAGKKGVFLQRVAREEPDGEHLLGLSSDFALERNADDLSSLGRLNANLEAELHVVFAG
jgi:hypothetical protein